MDDAVQISTERFRDTYVAGFETWARLYSRVIRNCKLPAHCFFAYNTFPRQPVFPRNLDLKHDSGHVLASGSSIWGSSLAKCAHDIPSFQQLVHLEVTVQSPVLLSISESAQSSCYSASWFASKDDYLTILVLAWAYILSARWVEVMPASCCLIYTESQARHKVATTKSGNGQHSLVVDIGPASPEEARWWAAVLAQGQGWQATMLPSFWSPWSIRLRSSLEFFLSSAVSASPSLGSTATFLDACDFLNNFCVRHNIVDQSHAALAAVLLFPSMGNCETLQMPSPRITQDQLSELALDHAEGSSELNWIHDGQHLDRFLTLSCNIRGIHPLLLSVFYEPSIECNAVTPWLQGTLAAIDSLTENNLSILGRMCMDRTPNIACIWLGITVLGLQKKLLKDVRFGQIPIDLHSAAWSGTVQSFIQQPVSKPLAVNGYVKRADECRLLYLTQSDNHARAPVCQWKPFGGTPTDDVEIEVRSHAQCEGHQLQYQGFAWACIYDNSEYNVLDKVHVDLPYSPSSTQGLECVCHIPVVWDSLNRKNEVFSENATRSVLGWLRLEGHARHERNVWQHDWFQVYDSDEEETVSSESSVNNLESSVNNLESLQKIQRWKSSLESSMGCSSMG
jgi:hypothetical protein